MTFALHPQLAADTLPIGDLGLSRLVLMDDARYPWLILVPRRVAAVEILDLPAPDRALLMEEVALCSAALKQLVSPRKLNIGAIGNKVAQLHLHVVARFETDAAWPEPVWGRGARVPYEDAAGRGCAAAISALVGLR